MNINAANCTSSNISFSADSRPFQRPIQKKETSFLQKSLKKSHFMQEQTTVLHAEISCGKSRLVAKCC